MNTMKKNLIFKTTTRAKRRWCNISMVDQYESRDKVVVGQPKKKLVLLHKLQFPNLRPRRSISKKIYHVCAGQQPSVTTLSSVNTIFVGIPNESILYRGIKLDLLVVDNIARHRR